MGVSGRRVRAIVNPFAVRGGRRERWRKLRDELVARGLTVEERETERRGARGGFGYRIGLRGWF